jgi:hypothetical protein
MEISAQVRVISLGQPDAIRPALEASRLARTIPGATYDIVTDAIHFSAFNPASQKVLIFFVKRVMARPFATTGNVLGWRCTLYWRR